MFNKFTEGVFFGAGFAISFVAIWYFAAYFITPSFTSYSVNSQDTVEIKDTKKAKIISEIKQSSEHKKYSFFKSNGEKRAVPHNGGVLYMAKLPTDNNSIKPYTVQLWLTEKELWLIKTTNKNPEVKLLSYPKNNARDSAFEILHKYTSFQAGSSSTTISEQTINMLKQGFARERGSMNGKLQITEDGVVFLDPNEYKA